MRRKIKNKKELRPDLVFNSTKVAKFTNYIMGRGKKTVARKIVYDAMELIKEKTKTQNPLEIFDTALKNTVPNLEVKSRRVEGQIIKCL